MSLRFPVRRATRVAAPFVFAVVVALACADDNEGGAALAPHQADARNDNLVAEVIGGIAVRTDVSLSLQDGFRVSQELDSTNLPLVHFRSADAGMTLSPSVTMRQVMADGVTLSIVFFRDRTTGMPTQILVYQDGELRSSTRPRYVRFGSAWIRQSSDVTLFTAAGDTEAVAHSENLIPSLASSRAPNDALRATALTMMPGELSAVTASCLSAKLNFAFAAIGLAAALAALDAAYFMCGSTIVGCPALVAAAIAVNSAMANYNNALERMHQACGPDGSGGNPTGTRTFK